MLAYIQIDNKVDGNVEEFTFQSVFRLRKF